MSILIRGEEMPKNCVVCKNYDYCELWSKLTVNKRCKERHPDCPLVEVKINNKENVMTSNEIINKAFKLACQYLQYNAPSTFVTYEPDEIQACCGSASYEDGWKQWAKYFLYKVESNTDTDLVKMLREGM